MRKRPRCAGELTNTSTDASALFLSSELQLSGLRPTQAGVSCIFRNQQFPEIDLPPASIAGVSGKMLRDNVDEGAGVPRKSVERVWRRHWRDFRTVAGGVPHARARSLFGPQHGRGSSSGR